VRKYPGYAWLLLLPGLNREILTVAAGQVNHSFGGKRNQDIAKALTTEHTEFTEKF
jgi:hypothetical protein